MEITIADKSSILELSLLANEIAANDIESLGNLLEKAYEALRVTALPNAEILCKRAHKTAVSSEPLGIDKEEYAVSSMYDNEIVKIKSIMREIHPDIII